MNTILIEHLQGKLVEGVFEVESTIQNKYINYHVYLKLKDIGYVFMDSLDPDEINEFSVSDTIPKANRPCVGNAKIIGSIILDVIKSDHISSIGFLCNNGYLIINEIGEFRNSAEILEMPKFVNKMEFTSLIKK